MTGMEMTVTVAGSEYRPCWVCKGRKALFHRWVDSARPVQSRDTEEGDKRYQLYSVQGLVEFEDGTMDRVWPQDIQFIDCRPEFQEYAWPEELPFNFETAIKGGAGRAD